MTSGMCVPFSTKCQHSDVSQVFDEKLTRLFTAVNSRTEVFVSLQQQWTRKFLTWTKAEVRYAICPLPNLC